MLRLNRMTDYAIVVLGALAHRRGEVLATAQIAGLTGLAAIAVAVFAFDERTPFPGVAAARVWTDRVKWLI